MTTELRRYVLVDEQDIEGLEEFDNLHDAKVVAMAGATRQCAIVAHVYELTDTELIWTPDGEDVWPPSAREGQRL